MPECEICGRESEKLTPIMVEGAVLLACFSCSQGKKKAYSQQHATRKPMQRNREKKRFPEYELAEDYAEQLKKLRQEKGMTLEEFAKKINEQVSVVKKMESGKMVPTRKTALRIMNAFGLRLYERAKEEE